LDQNANDLFPLATEGEQVRVVSVPLRQLGSSLLVDRRQKIFLQVLELMEQLRPFDDPLVSDLYDSIPFPQVPRVF
jgi:hypothetical protein